MTTPAPSTRTRCTMSRQWLPRKCSSPPPQPDLPLVRAVVVVGAGCREPTCRQGKELPQGMHAQVSAFGVFWVE